MKRKWLDWTISEAPPPRQESLTVTHNCSMPCDRYWAANRRHMIKTAAREGTLEDGTVLPTILWAHEVEGYDREACALEEVEVVRHARGAGGLVVDEDVVLYDIDESQGEDMAEGTPATVRALTTPNARSPYQQALWMRERRDTGDYSGPLPALNMVPGFLGRCPAKYTDDRERRAKVLDHKTFAAVLE